MNRDPIVKLQDVTKYFEVKRDIVQKITSRERQFIKAVDGISLHIHRGEVFGLVGESGSGKTTVGKLILNVMSPTQGEVFFENADISGMKKPELKPFRRKIQVIFQDPYASLNPRMKIGKALVQPLEIHGIAAPQERKQRVLGLLEHVGLTPAEIIFNKYPHQLSGGQRQRIVIARALMLNPDFVVADEPIAMADVSMRVLLLELMMNLKQEFNLTYLFITHDLATAKYVCDRIAIMYLGKIMELGTLKEVYANPLHPYTRALLEAVPVPDPQRRRQSPIPQGEIPNPINPPSGCRFHPRCPYRMDMCSREEPGLEEKAPAHSTACHLPVHSMPGS
ncbi:MAG: ABC transporter ATP-binding protein [Spirochaetota bacterium]